MELRQGLPLEARQELRQSIELRQEQRLVVRCHILALRLQIIESIREEEYKPEGICPKCGREMTLREILDGFSADPKDYTTSCTRCGHRFPPKLLCGKKGVSHIEMPFYCSAQSIAQLRGKESLTTEEFDKQHPALFRSLIFHFGTLTNGFKNAGLTYLQEDLSGWQDRIKAFLGRLPDTVIAKFVNVPAKSVSRLRHQHGIAAYSVRKALAEAEASVN